jgi:hypothetical protein
MFPEVSGQRTASILRTGAAASKKDTTTSQMAVYLNIRRRVKPKSSLLHSHVAHFLTSFLLRCGVLRQIV